MDEILMDTSALIAFFVHSEKNHPLIRDFFLQHSFCRWLILSTVFDETVTWIRAKVSTYHSIQIGRVLREEHRYIPLSLVDDLATWQAFRHKAWSYTDCSLLVMASRLGVYNVAAFDDHIRQMQGLGVRCLPL